MERETIVGIQNNESSINHNFYFILPLTGQGYPDQGQAYPPPAQQQTTTNVAVSSLAMYLC